ncbi:MAG TPA: Gfo/Idh/MocA family oxidoreductase [Casimicrobiaceae bacterium]|jgi:predicted dehydrogenase
MIGAGWVTQHHLISWNGERPRAKVVAIADPIVSRAQERAREFDIAQTFSDTATLLANADVDALDVATPRGAHAEPVLLAAERGIPVLCQKPIAPTLAQAETLVAQVGQRTRLMIHENWRFRRYYREARRWLDDGVAGDIKQARMTLLSSGLVPDVNGKCPALERQPFLRTLDRMLVMEVLIHHLDTLRFLLGPLCVSAAHIGQMSPELIGEDNAMVLLRTSEGAPVLLHGNMAAHGHPPVFVDRMELLGDRGTINLSDGRLTAIGRIPRDVQFDLAACYQASYDAAIGHFVDALLSGAPFETGADDNLETIRLVERIYALNGR